MIGELGLSGTEIKRESTTKKVSPNNKISAATKRGKAKGNSATGTCGNDGNSTGKKSKANWDDLQGIGAWSTK